MPSPTSDGSIMPKLRESELVCPYLRRSRQIAEDLAIDNMGSAPAEGWPYKGYFIVVGKGTGIGEAKCTKADCPKRVTVIKTASDIGATNVEGEPISAYDVLSAKTTTKVSGHKCPEDNNQR